MEAPTQTHPASGGPSPSSPKSRWVLAGALAVALVAAVVVVLLLTVFASDSDADGTAEFQAKVNRVMNPVIRANERVSDRLSGLRGTRVAPARAAVTEAEDATLTAQGGVAALTVPDGSEQAARNVRGTLNRETSYLAAVDTALRNPSSATASQTQTLAANLTDALNTISPEGKNWAASVSGADRLTAWAQKAAKRKRAAARRARDDDQAAAPAAPSAPAALPGGSDCGDGVYAGPNTSCPFAFNVRDAYNEAPGASATVRVYSPVTDQTYTMSCSPAGNGVTCSGGNGASVSWSY